jgi:hypothetical protein
LAAAGLDRLITQKKLQEASTGRHLVLPSGTAAEGTETLQPRSSLVFSLLNMRLENASGIITKMLAPQTSGKSSLENACKSERLLLLCLLQASFIS